MDTDPGTPLISPDREDRPRDRYSGWLFFTYGLYSAVAIVPLAYWVAEPGEPFSSDVARYHPDYYFLFRLLYSLLTVCLFWVAGMLSRDDGVSVSFGRLVITPPGSFWPYFFVGAGFTVWGIILSQSFTVWQILVITGIDLVYQSLFLAGRGISF